MDKRSDILLTVLDVYNAMTECKKWTLTRLVNAIVSDIFISDTERNYLKECFSYFTEREKLVSYYLVAQALKLKE